MTLLVSPFPYFQDASGNPLEAGKIYIGVAGLDPVANPKTVHWDVAKTAVAAQPIRTVQGFPQNSSSPANIHIDGDYSISVRTSADAEIYTELNVGDAVGGLGDQIAVNAAAVTDVEADLVTEISRVEGLIGDIATVNYGAIDRTPFAFSSSNGVFSTYTFPAGTWVVLGGQIFLDAGEGTPQGDIFHYSASGDGLIMSRAQISEGTDNEALFNSNDLSAYFQVKGPDRLTADVCGVWSGGDKIKIAVSNTGATTSSVAMRLIIAPIT